jgi:predicted alpha/beta-fold hydrolase
VTALINAHFTPATPWLTGNLQTIADRVRPRHHDLAAVSTQTRLLVSMADESGDSLAVRLHDPVSAARPDRPIVLVVHGLGGSIDSTYVRATSLGLLRAGYRVARVDLRGVGDSSQHCRMLYHGGRTQDLRWVLQTLAERSAANGVALVGFSLGGNVTLKLLGEPLDGIPVRAGVSVSAPLDLSVGIEHLQRRMFGFYERFLVHRLKADTAASGLVLTEAELRAVGQVSTLTQFDDLITAKHNGWADAAEYYSVNSSAQFLPHIEVPTLVVHAVDDPMVPVGPYEAIDWTRLAERTPVRHAVTRTGGHVGFHEQGAELPWYVARAVAFLDAV